MFGALLKHCTLEKQHQHQVHEPWEFFHQCDLHPGPSTHLKIGVLISNHCGKVTTMGFYFPVWGVATVLNCCVNNYLRNNKTPIFFLHLQEIISIFSGLCYKTSSSHPQLIVIYILYHSCYRLYYHDNTWISTELFFKMKHVHNNILLIAICGHDK